MGRLVIAAVLLALAVPASASAWTTVNGIADPALAARYRDWQATSQIPTPHVTVNIEQRTCDEGAGFDGIASFACVHIERSPMVLVFPDFPWLWGLTDPDRLKQQREIQADYYHELAHIRDFQPHRKGFKWRYRERFAKIMGWTADSYVYQSWSPAATTQQGYVVDPKEQFAMASAWCAFSRTELVLGDWAANYHYTPTVAQHRAVCRLLKAPLR